MISIALIVKNEEKNLKRCLLSLKPLTDAIPCEVIVVDTGSIDKTVEIAKEFKGKVYNFTWINDFSAARNFCMSKCTGDWMLYLDADEALDSDASALIDFFNKQSDQSPVCTASLRRKNYVDESFSAYTENRVQRIINLKIGSPKFVGAIHEALEVSEPCIKLNQFIHHYGYAIPSEELKEKHRRNMEGLLSAYQSGDRTPRLLAHLFYSCEPSDKEKYLSEWYESLGKPYRDIYSVPVYVALIQTLLDGNCTEDSLFYVDEYIGKYADDISVTTISVLALGICGLAMLQQHSNVLAFFEVYSELFEKFENGDVKSDELNTCVVFFGLSEFDYCSILLLAANSALLLGNKALGHDIISRTSEELMPEILKDQYHKLLSNLK